VAAALIPESLLRMRKRLQAGRGTRMPMRNPLIAPDFARRTRLLERLADLSARQPYPLADTALRERALELTGPYLAAGIERYGRVAAAHGCEPRHPFLDRRVIGFALALPDSQRQRDGWPKWILRETMRDVLPEQICWRRGKEHLGWPTTRGLLDRIGPARLQAIANDSATLEPYLDMGRLRAQLQHWLQHHDDDSYEPLYAAVTLHAWLQRAARSRM
jgi:asparagine synthase (glutamine-hydrolysing)